MLYLRSVREDLLEVLTKEFQTQEAPETACSTDPSFSHFHLFSILLVTPPVLPRINLVGPLSSQNTFMISHAWNNIAVKFQQL